MQKMVASSEATKSSTACQSNVLYSDALGHSSCLLGVDHITLDY